VRSAELEELWPGLATSEYSITSPQEPRPNCIGWALGDTTHFWEPGPPTVGYYWPPNAPQDDSLSSWIRIFELHGYRTCDSAEFEQGKEKVAIYLGLDGLPSHVARQKASGLWTSKLGKLEDIQHDTLEALVVMNMVRSRKLWRDPVREKGYCLGERTDHRSHLVSRW
jgi:hypothetical protein